MNLSIVIPIRNEEDNILPLYQQLITELVCFSNLDKFEIIVIDDGSTDTSVHQLSSISDPRLKVVSVGAPIGKSAALERGFHLATFETIATLDGDLQNDASALDRMMSLITQGADFVQGYRVERRDPLLKRISSKAANLIHRWVLRDSFKDINCGQRVFRKKCLAAIEFFQGAHRFFPYLVQEGGYVVVECKVRHYPRIAGHSKYGLFNRLIEPTKNLIRLSLAQMFGKRAKRKTSVEAKPLAA